MLPASNDVHATTAAVQTLSVRAEDLGLRVWTPGGGDGRDPWLDRVIADMPREAGVEPFAITEPKPGCLAMRLAGRVFVAITTEAADRLAREPGFPAHAAIFTPESGRRALRVLVQVYGDLNPARPSDATNEQAVSAFTAKLARAYESLSLYQKLGRSLGEPDRADRVVAAALQGAIEMLDFGWSAARFDENERLCGPLSGQLLVYSNQPAPPGLNRVIRQRLDAVPESVEAGALPSDDPLLGSQFVAEPVRVGEQHVGTVFLGQTHALRRSIDSFDLQTAESISVVIGSMLNSSRLYQRQQATFLGVLRALSFSLDAKDHDTRGHSQRVALLARELARSVGATEERAQRVYLAGILHDIGKIGVPDSILTKPDGLSDHEADLMKRHPVIGHEILRGIPTLEDVLPGVLHHHERWDGRGYPAGLAGEEIPQIARLLGLADAFDAMTSSRSYRGAMPVEAARGEVERCAGAHFDPSLVPAFLTLDLASFCGPQARLRLEADSAEAA